MSEKTLKIIEEALDLFYVKVDGDRSLSAGARTRMLELIEQAQSEVEEVLF